MFRTGSLSKLVQQRGIGELQCVPLIVRFSAFVRGRPSHGSPLPEGAIARRLGRERSPTALLQDNLANRPAGCTLLFLSIKYFAWDQQEWLPRTRRHIHLPPFGMKVALEHCRHHKTQKPITTLTFQNFHHASLATMAFAFAV